MAEELPDNFAEIAGSLEELESQRTGKNNESETEGLSRIERYRWVKVSSIETN